MRITLLQATLGFAIILPFIFIIVALLTYLALVFWNGAPDTSEKRRKTFRAALVTAGWVAFILVLLLLLGECNSDPLIT